MENQLTFNEAMFAAAGPMQVAWLYWMSFALIVPPAVLAFSRATRLDAVIITVTNIAMLWGMSWIYDQMGFVRLMGIVHVILWTPLLIYLVRRVRSDAIPTLFRVAMLIFMATIGISLVFDYTDTVRYLLGERASII
jgi:hypothetical protein